MRAIVQEFHNYGGARAGQIVDVSEEELRLHPQALRPATPAQATMAEGDIVSQIRDIIHAAPDEYPDLPAAVRMWYGHWKDLGARCAEQEKEIADLRTRLAEALHQLESATAPRKR